MNAITFLLFLTNIHRVLSDFVYLDFNKTTGLGKHCIAVEPIIFISLACELNLLSHHLELQF